MTAFRLRITDGDLQQAVLGLPWETPLEHWPDDTSWSRGIHRHVVRYVRVADTLVVCKELPDRLAEREYSMLVELRERGIPAVTLLGTAVTRHGVDGEPLEAVLMTRALSYAVPLHRLFSGALAASMRQRLVDAVSLLLVRVHSAGFFWGDCSLSNILFRLDAGSLRAYVVDTETGELHAQLSDGQRTQDLQIAVENICGGLFDLQASGVLEANIDPVDTAAKIEERYQAVWSALTRTDQIGADELWRVQSRLRELNDLGFDAEEVEIRESGEGWRLRPIAVEEGHHHRRLMRLVGITAHENQARRILADINGYATWLSTSNGRPLPEAIAAYRWLTERWEPVIAQLPPDAEVEPTQFFHEVLDHCWYLSEQAGHDVGLEAAAHSYLDRTDPPGQDRLP